MANNPRTPEELAICREMRLAGHLTQDIADRLGRHVVKVRGWLREMGLGQTVVKSVLSGQIAEPEMVLDGRRECLPPGHPVTWGAITAGTVLEGSEYR